MEEGKSEVNVTRHKCFDHVLIFLYPAHEVGAGDIVTTMSCRAAVRLCVRVSFPDDISETHIP